MRFGMMNRFTFGCLAGFMLLFSTEGFCLAEEKAPKTIAEVTSGMVHKEGLIDSYLDADAGKVYLVLPAATDQSMGQFLYYEGLKSGLGSNPVGLDRNQLGNTRFI